MTRDVARGRWPSLCPMLSRDTEEVIRRRHEEYLAFRQATAADAIIGDFYTHPEHSLEYRQGFRCSYAVRMHTYRGWRVWMLHTGCFASIPGAEEDADG